MSLQKAILGLLTYRPMTGYDLKQYFDQSINYFWSAQLSQIYRELGALESEGCVFHHTERQDGGRPDRKVYSITKEGEAKFQQWLEKFPQTLSPVIRDEFVMRVFFSSRVAPEELAFQLKRYIKEEQELLDSLAALEGMIDAYAREISRPGEKFYWRLTLKRGYIMTGAAIRWARECLDELEKNMKNHINRAVEGG